METQFDNQVDAQLNINHSDVPIRLFKSDFLEFFTHVHSLTIILIWVPFSLYMHYWGYSLCAGQAGLAYLPIGFVVGLFVWTFAEYNIHRFFFHFHPHNPW